MNIPPEVLAAEIEPGVTVASVVGGEEPLLLPQPKVSLLQIWTERMRDAEAMLASNPKAKLSLERARLIVASLEQTPSEVIQGFLFNHALVFVFFDEQLRAVVMVSRTQRPSA